MQRKFGVKASSISDYKMLVKRIADLFWEINYKFKSKGKSFPKMAKEFFGFNNPSSHGHAPKPISSTPLSL